MEGLLQFWKDIQELLPFHMKLTLILVATLVPLVVSFITYKILTRKKKKPVARNPEPPPKTNSAAPVTEPESIPSVTIEEETPTVPEPTPAVLTPPSQMVEALEQTGDESPTTVMDSFSPPPLPDEPNFDFASSPTIMPFDEEATSPESEATSAAPQIGEDDATVLMPRQPPRDSLDN